MIVSGEARASDSSRPTPPVTTRCADSLVFRQGRTQLQALRNRWQGCRDTDPGWPSPSIPSGLSLDYRQRTKSAPCSVRPLSQNSRRPSCASAPIGLAFVPTRPRFVTLAQLVSMRISSGSSHKAVWRSDVDLACTFSWWTARGVYKSVRRIGVGGSPLAMISTRCPHLCGRRP
jgi:hypothetical protein